MSYPSFNSGDILNASDMNAVGMWKITPTVTSVGGTAATVSGTRVLFGNGNTSITVTAFSSNYRNYRLLFSDIDTSLDGQELRMSMGNALAAGHYGSTSIDAYTGAGAAVIRQTNGNYWTISVSSTAQQNFLSIDLLNPQLASPTGLNGVHFGNIYSGYIGGMHAANTAYTQIHLTLQGGSFVSGSLDIYGYRN